MLSIMTCNPYFYRNCNSILACMSSADAYDFPVKAMSFIKYKNLINKENYIYIIYVPICIDNMILFHYLLLYDKQFNIEILCYQIWYVKL